MKKSKYSAKQEQEIMQMIWSPELRDNPYLYVMAVFPWGVEGTPLANFKGPRKWQKRFLLMVARHIQENEGRFTATGFYKVLKAARASGRGIGKSALVSWVILWFISTRIGATSIVSANGEPQLRSVTWAELIKWLALSINEHWWEPTATRLAPATWIADLVEKQLQKGTRYWGAEGKLWSEENPDAYAGPHNPDGMLVIFDEASGIPDPIWSVAQGYFTENVPHRFMFAFSNPRRPVGMFYDCFHSKSEFWETEQINALEVEGTDRQLYEEIIAEHGEDSDQARIEVYGIFPEVGDEFLISSQLAKSAMEREAVSVEGEVRILGIDPGSGRPDPCSLVMREGLVVEKEHIIDIIRSDAMELVGEIMLTIKKWKPDIVVVDLGGLGWGIHGRLKELGVPIHGVNFAWKSSNAMTYGNKRAEMWVSVRDWLRYGSLPKDKRLSTELCCVKKKMHSSGVLFLESKEDIKKRVKFSPNRADALALTFGIPYKTGDLEREKVKKRHESGSANGPFQSLNVATSWMAR